MYRMCLDPNLKIKNQDPDLAGSWFQNKIWTRLDTNFLDPVKHLLLQDNNL